MKKIAVIRRNGIGDFISGTVPLCNYLDKKYNHNVQFYFFMESRNFGLAKYFFPNSESILIPSGNKYFAAISTALKYRSIKPNIGVIPVPDYPKLSSIFMKVLGAEKVYGNVRGNFIAKSLISNPCTMYDNRDGNNYHVSLHSLNLVDPTLTETSKDIYPRFVKSQIQPFELINKQAKNYVMVELSNNRVTSQLSLEKTAAILNELSKVIDFVALITVLPPNEAKAQQLQKLINVPCEYHITKNLDEFISYVDKSTYVLAGDGGLSHIAGALGKKLVSLYGITYLELWGVLGDHVISLRDLEDVNNIPNDKIITAFQSLINT